MYTISIILLLIVILTFLIPNCKGVVHPDFLLNEKQLIKKHGYPLEVHTVQTQDGYILELHRIPYSKKSKSANNRPAVLLIPGLFSSSSTFLYFGPETGLGYLLADNGYDVWMGNNRGTTWSKKHVLLNTSTHNMEYWNFNLQHLGKYDLPAFIDYILDVTQQEKLFYVGYSQGTTIFFIMMSEKPEYNEKIRLMISLSTSLDFSNSTSMLTAFIGNWNDVEYILNTKQFYGIAHRNPEYAKMAQGLCNIDAPLNKFCLEMCYTFGGWSRKQMNKTILPLFASNAPNGVSTQQLIHNFQLFKDKFQKYDYGPEANYKIYGQFVPPKYNLSLTETPVAIYHGLEDNMIVAQNLDKLDAVLPKNVVEKKVYSEFGHLDVIWGIDAAKIIFSDFMDLMKSF